MGRAVVVEPDFDPFAIPHQKIVGFMNAIAGANAAISPVRDTGEGN